MRDANLSIPEISDLDRAMGYKVLPVMFVDGHAEALKVHRPDPMEFVRILGLDTMTARIYGSVAHALRADVEFATNIHGKSITEVFLLANRLASEVLFLNALNACGEIGEQMILEASGGKFKTPGNN